MEVADSSKNLICSPDCSASHSRILFVLRNYLAAIDSDRDTNNSDEDGESVGIVAALSLIKDHLFSGLAIRPLPVIFQ
jgi:hypothetical protein